MSTESCACNEIGSIVCLGCFRESFGLSRERESETKRNNKKVFVKSAFDHIKYNSHIPKPGMKFGKLTTLIRNKSYSKTYWSCRCDCGKKLWRLARLDLLEGKVTQCRSCDNKSRIDNVLHNSIIVPLEVLK